MSNKSIAIAALTLAVLTGAFAQAKKAAAPTCPVCHMALSTKKTAADPVAMKLTKTGKTVYCCSKCKMPASMLVKKAGK